MSRVLFDTNVLLDLATRDSTWYAWSEAMYRDAVAEGLIAINPIIYAELAPAFPSREALDQWLDPEWFERLDLPYAASWIAGQAFKSYRRQGGTRVRLLPDFYIGAHAQAAGLILVTRDVTHFRSYFPSVSLISPEDA